MFLLRFTLLFVTWCAFSGHFDALHLGLGALSCLWVAAISSHIALTQTSQIPTNIGVWLVRMAGYAIWLLIEIIKANVQVIRFAFMPKLTQHITPTIVEFRTRLVGDFPRFLLAHSITLTPGTVTVRVDGDRFTVHALTQEIADGVPGGMEDRLLKIFGHGSPRESAPDG